MFAEYADLENLMSRKDAGSASSAYLNWTTIPAFDLEPDDQDGKYHITYSFIGSAMEIAHYNGTALQTYHDNFVAAASALKNTINSILNPTTNFSAFFSDVANISFSIPSSGPAMVDIGVTSSGLGAPTLPSTLQDRTDPEDLDYNSRFHGDVWLLESYQSGASSGSLAYYNIVHEVAHSLGLKHPNEETPSDIFSQRETIMSYSMLDGMGGSSAVYASGLQILDIAALQKIYGRNYSTRDEDNSGVLAYKAGNGFASGASNPFIYTIWDGGGIDTIDASAYADGVKIDLRQGAFSSIGKAADSSFNGLRGEGLIDHNVSIAFHTVIENAIGTDEADIIIGNEWGNRLDGGKGVDYLYGSGWEYNLDPGFIAIDPMDLNDPNRARPKSDDDIFAGGEGSDIIYGGAGRDTIDHSSDTNIAPIVVTLNADGNGTATDGWGDVDTLHSIEGFIGSVYDDSISLASVMSGVFDGGLGIDTLGYTQVTHALDNVNNRIYKDSKYDTFSNFEIIASRAQVVLVDTTREDGHMGGEGVHYNTLEGYVHLMPLLDYSLSEESMVFNLNMFDSAHGNVYRRDLQMNATNSMDSVDQFAVLMDAETTLDIMTPYSIVDTVYLRGSHMGDTVYYLDATETGYNEFVFYSGRGDDRFELFGSTDSVGIGYGYTGGNDVITSASLLANIIMGEGILPGDVTVASGVISISGRGTITLFDDDFPFDYTISYGGLKGTWSDDFFSGAIGNLDYSGYAGNDVIHGGTGVTEIDGGVGDDQIYANAGINILYGGPDNDSFFIGDVLQADIYDEDGINTVTLTTVSIDDFIYDFDVGLSSLSFFNFVNDPLVIHDYRSFSNIYFSDLSAIAVHELVAGGQGEYGVTHSADLVNAYAATASVTINMLSGNDTYYASSYGDTVYGGAGHDTIIGDWGDDVLYGDSGNDYLDGWAGYNILYGGSGDDDLYVNTGMSDLYGGSGDDCYYVSAGAYSYISDVEGENYLYVMDIDSTQFSYVFDGFSGFYLYDEFENEFLFLEDHSNFFSITFSDNVEVEFDSLSGGGGNNQGFVATEGDDVIYAANAPGAVTLDLLGGNDMYDASSYGDVVHGGDGDDVLYGWSGNDVFWGDDGDDILYGFGGDDVLSGGDGVDYLYGGDGADTFIFTDSSSWLSVDYVGDFNVTEGDAWDLKDFLTLYDPLSDAITDFIQITEGGGNSSVFVDRDGLGVSYSSVQVAQITGVTGITDVENLITNGYLIVN